MFYKTGATETEKKEVIDMAEKVCSALYSGEVRIGPIHGAEMRLGRPRVKKEKGKENAKPVTVADLIPLPVKPKSPQRKKVGIKKSNTPVMTSPESMKIIKENHVRKTAERKRKAEKESVAKAAVRRMSLRKKPIKSNPRLCKYIHINRQIPVKSGEKRRRVLKVLKQNRQIPVKSGERG